MEDVRVTTHHVYPKKRKAAKKLEKEMRAKRNVNPSRRIKHEIVGRWEKEEEYDTTADHCDIWSDAFHVYRCGTCEKCTGKPSQLVETGWEELMDDFKYYY